jgi:hypothetical protein
MLYRKLVVCALIGGVWLVANAAAVADWLARAGLVEAAMMLLSEFLTGTAISVITVLVILLPGRLSTGPERRSDRWPFD